MQTSAGLVRPDPRLSRLTVRGPWCSGQRHDDDCRGRRSERPVRRLPGDWEWATSEELAAWLGLEPAALSWLRQKKQAPRGHKIGKGILYRRGDVEQWLATRADQ